MKKTKRLLALFLTLCMTVTMFPSMAMASISMPDEANYDVAPIAAGAPEVSPAPLADTANSIDQKDLCKSYSAKITDGQGTKNEPKVVEVSARDLVKHKSAKVSDPQMGYWVGVTFAPPEGVEADSLKFKEGTAASIFDSVDADNEAEFDNDTSKTWSYYFDASQGNEHFIKLVWSKDGGDNVTCYYKIDSSNVKTVDSLLTKDSVDKATLGDHSTAPIPSEKIIDGYSVHATQGDDAYHYTVDLTGSDVKYHLNGADPEQSGYWVGFCVKAPEGNDIKVKYAIQKNPFDREPSTWIENNGDGSLDEKIDAQGKNGFAYYLDASTVERDYLALQFYKNDGGEDKAVTPVTYFEINNNVTKDSMKLEKVGFTYNADNKQLEDAKGSEKTITDCARETFYAKLNNDFNAGKYILVVKRDGNYLDYGVSDTTENKATFLYWSYLNPDQVSPNNGIIPGTYTFELYTYTGDKLPGGPTGDGLTYSNGEPKAAGRTFQKLASEAGAVSVTDNLTTATVTEAKGVGAESSKAVVKAEATVSDHTINITGSAANLGESENIQVTLDLSNATDPTAGTVVVKIEKSKGADGWKNPTVTIDNDATTLPNEGGATFNLMKKGDPFTVNAKFDVLEEKVLEPEGEVVTSEGADDATQKAASEIKPPSVEKESQSVFEEVATETAANRTIDREDALEKLNKAVQGGGKNDGEMNIFILPEVKVAVEQYEDNSTSGGARTLTLDISAVYKVVASTNDGDDLKFEGDYNVEKSDVNAAVVDTIPMTVTEPVTIKVGLPNNFAGVGENKVYVTHKGKYIYNGGVKQEGSDLFATFTTTHGFSEFVISTVDSTVASVDGVNYTSFQDAVDAVADATDKKITLGIGAGAAKPLTAYAPSREVIFTINASTSGVKVDSEVTIKDNGYYKVTRSEGATESKATYTVKYDAPSTPPAPSTPSATVNVTNPVNGYFSVSNPNAKAGDTVTVNTKPDDGYVVDQVTVTDKNGNTVEVKDNGDGTYSFTMPADDLLPVDVSVTFKEDAGGEVTPPTENALVFSSASQEKAIKNRTTTDADTSLKLKAADESVTIGSLKDWDVISDNEAVVQVLQPSHKLHYVGVGKANITVKATGSDGKVYSIVIPINVKLGTPTFTLSHYSSKKARTFTVTTSTVRGATGFQVKYSLKKSLKSSKTKSYKCGKKLKRQTIKANKTRRIYYVRVRAYKTVDGKRTYGAWSKLTKTIRSR